MLSGANCAKQVEPVGTLKPNAEEYANLEYLACVAFNGQAQNCVAFRR